MFAFGFIFNRIYSYLVFIFEPYMFVFILICVFFLNFWTKYICIQLLFLNRIESDSYTVFFNQIYSYLHAVFFLNHIYSCLVLSFNRIYLYLVFIFELNRFFDQIDLYSYLVLFLNQIYLYLFFNQIYSYSYSWVKILFAHLFPSSWNSENSHVEPQRNETA